MDTHCGDRRLNGQALSHLSLPNLLIPPAPAEEEGEGETRSEREGGRKRGVGCRDAGMCGRGGGKGGARETARRSARARATERRRKSDREKDREIE